MNLVGHREWREIVKTHYGSLDAFTDAQTVRIMLRFLLDNIKDELEFRKTLPEPWLSEWQSATDATLLEAQSEVSELQLWLSNKGLKL